MRSTFRAFALGLALLPAVVGCSELSAPSNGSRVIGIIEWQNGASRGVALASADPQLGYPNPIQAPDTVRVNESFTATITTLGPSGCWSEAGAETTSAALQATVTPFDRSLERPGVFCTAAIVALSRPVQLRFTAAGEATLRVNGRRVIGQDFAGGVTTSVEKRIVVR